MESKKFLDMKKHRLSFLWRLLPSVFVMLGVAGSVPANGQGLKRNSYWHNGSYFVWVQEETDTAFTTFMGTLHEGAGSQPWYKTSRQGVYLRPNQVGNAWTDTVIRFNNRIVYKNIGGQEALLVYGRDNTNLEDIFLRYDGHPLNKWYDFVHGFDSVLVSDIRSRIVGTYHAGVLAWTFTTDSVEAYSVGGQKQSAERYGYTVRWSEFDTPQNILVLSDGRIIWIEQTAEGIDLYDGISHIEAGADSLEWISRGELLAHLREYDVDQSVPGRWPEASTTLLTRGYLEPYPTEVLRLMRNEIFARHGRTFADKRLADFYYREGQWYSNALQHPTPDQLSEIERLNVQLIKAIEQERKADSKNK